MGVGQNPIQKDFEDLGRVGLVTHSAYLDHVMGRQHPESPERLLAILAKLESSGTISKLTRINPRKAENEWITRVHDPAYVQQLEARAPRTGSVSLDADTAMSPGSWPAALLAAGGAMAAVDAIMDHEVDQVFCAVRPPGHHAEANRAMGFCLLNTVAIATRYIQERHGLMRVLIIDWDVHHGNGTQHVFEDDASVLFFSTHQYPHYPGTGSDKERGRGPGEGMTINVPMSSGQGPDDYREIFETVLVPAADAFQPEFIVISAGFDAHQDDPLASMAMTDEGYGELARLVSGIANRHCDGRIVACLEGGYHLRALAASVEQTLLAWMDA